jgi:hypothetical protein
MKLLLKKAKMQDSARIHKMQAEAFRALYEKYKDHATNPAATGRRKAE